jgi:hypothetical protein
MALSGLESQRVIALRLSKMAAGGPAAEKEARRMVTEKITAAVEAATTLVAGGTAEQVVRRYRTIIRSNKTRLLRKKR